MKKLILIGVGVAMLLGGGLGGAALFFANNHAPKHAAKLPPPPKPIYFAQLPDLVVSVPADAGDATASYVQITLQFASFDTNAVTSFTNLTPIIRADIISLLMEKTAKSLLDPATHDGLTKSCVDIANEVLDKSAGYVPPNPFTAAYITNLVEQN